MPGALSTMDYGDAAPDELAHQWYRIKTAFATMLAPVAAAAQDAGVAMSQQGTPALTPGQPGYDTQQGLLPNAAAGFASAVPGTIADLYNMGAGAVNWLAPRTTLGSHAGFAPPAPEATAGTTDWFGRQLGADPNNPGFAAGALASPGPGHMLGALGTVAGGIKLLDKAVEGTEGLSDVGKFEKTVGVLASDPATRTKLASTLGEVPDVEPIRLNLADSDRVTAGTISHESMPGSQTGHLPELAQSSPETQRQYHGLMEGVFSDQYGDRTVRAMGGYSGGAPFTGMPGYYNDPGLGRVVNNPVSQVPVLVGYGKGARRLGDETQPIVEGAAATRGLLTGQNSVGYNTFKEGQAAGHPRNAVEITKPGGFTTDEFNRLGDALTAKYGDRVAPIAVGQDRIRVLHFGEDVQSKKGVADSRKLIRSVLGKDASAEYGTNAGNLVGSFEGYKPSAYVQAIESHPVLRAGFEAVAPGQARALIALDEATGGKISPVLDRVRQEVANAPPGKALETLQGLVKQGVLPAAAAAVILHSMRQQGTLMEPPPGSADQSAAAVPLSRRGSFQ